MSSKILVCDQSKCSGCRACEIWCSFHHFQECNPSLARLIVVPFEDGEYLNVTYPDSLHQILNKGEG